MRERTMALRWSIVTAGLIALFWAIWGLVNDGVPGGWTYVLQEEMPFAISYWRELAITLILPTVVLSLLVGKRVALSLALFFGLVFGPVPVMSFGRSFGLIPKTVTDSGLATLLWIVIVFGLAFLLTSRQFWGKIWNWLMAK